MKDDFLSRDWADSHHDFSKGVAALFKCIAVGLARANAYQFDAPWRRTEKRSRAR